MVKRTRKFLIRKEKQAASVADAHADVKQRVHRKQRATSDQRWATRALRSGDWALPEAEANPWKTGKSGQTVEIRRWIRVHEGE